MHIKYDKKRNVEYAKLCISKRIGKSVAKSYTYLGLVLDKEKGIYKSKKRGVFTYDLDTDTYGLPDASYVPDHPSPKKEKLLLDFGDSFFLDAYIRKGKITPAIDALGYGNPDTLYSMLFYYILCSTANCHANDWWKGNYASILYPKANLTSQRISEFLAAIGSEKSQRKFFEQYFTDFLSNAAGTNILIDSTGLPNSIHFPLTAVRNHNGEVSNEVRLIYVTQQETGLPIYFRYCPGNVIDVSTLIRTIEELKSCNVNTEFAIFDAGYYDDANIAMLYENNISFVTRLKQNRKLYKNLVEDHLATLECKENFVCYNNRYAYIKCVPCQLIEGRSAYAYIGLDIERKNSETKKLFQRAKSKGLTDEDVFDRMTKQGLFILVSSRRIPEDKILPTYYTRQQIEQIFDIGKNYADMLPLRVQNEETFRGHLVLTFIATVILKQIQDHMKDTQYTPISLFLNMRNQKCKVYEEVVITQEPFKKVNDCYKIFGIDCPEAIIR
jgi:hypothetical protein